MVQQMLWVKKIMIYQVQRVADMAALVAEMVQALVLVADERVLVLVETRGTTMRDTVVPKLVLVEEEEVLQHLVVVPHVALDDGSPQYVDGEYEC